MAFGTSWRSRDPSLASLAQDDTRAGLGEPSNPTAHRASFAASLRPPYRDRAGGNGFRGTGLQRPLPGEADPGGIQALSPRSRGGGAEPDTPGSQQTPSEPRRGRSGDPHRLTSDTAAISRLAARYARPQAEKHCTAAVAGRLGLQHRWPKDAESGVRNELAIAGSFSRFARSG